MLSSSAPAASSIAFTEQLRQFAADVAEEHGVIDRCDALWSVAIPSTVARRGNDRLGAGACHGSRRRLRHSISAVGTEVPHVKA